MNKAILMGRLTKDVETRTTNSDKMVANFTLAVDRRFKQEGGQQADFFNCVAWGKTAEFVSKYFFKGQRVAVSGRIETRTWEDNDGNKRYGTDIVAEEVSFADGKRDVGGQQVSEPSFTKVDDKIKMPWD